MLTPIDKYAIRGAKHFTCIISVSSDLQERHWQAPLIDEEVPLRESVTFPAAPAASVAESGSNRSRCCSHFYWGMCLVVWILLQTREPLSLLPDLGCTELRLKGLQQVEMLMETRVQPGLAAGWVLLLSHSPVALGSSYSLL